MSLNRNKGFTLIEMLVVLSIIGILIGIGTVSYSSAQKNARDARRKAEVSYIQTVMEQYFSICGGQYPTPNGDSIAQPVICSSPTVAVAPTLPVDPVSASPYVCNSCNASAYQICATLENGTSYCLQNQQ